MTLQPCWLAHQARAALARECSQHMKGPGLPQVAGRDDLAACDCARPVVLRATSTAALPACSPQLNPCISLEKSTPARPDSQACQRNVHFECGPLRRAENGASEVPEIPRPAADHLADTKLNPVRPNCAKFPYKCVRVGCDLAEMSRRQAVAPGAVRPCRCAVGSAATNVAATAARSHLGSAASRLRL
jgi:hypothetical protein